MFGRFFSAQRLLIGFVLAMAVLMALAAGASAQPPTPPPTDTICTSCHAPEATAWQQSPHAAAGVACETCHGAYTPDHPSAESMSLIADSRQCRTCHYDTAAQWRQTEHAQSGVQCISCHVSHSQDTRLSNQVLCGACHADKIQDFNHTAHHDAGVSCIDCHAATTSDGAVSHRFTVIDTQSCLNCHASTIHEEGGASTKPASMQVSTLETENELLCQELESAKQQNRTLGVASVIGLGVGLGIGGIAGILFALIVLYTGKRGGASS